MSLKGKVILAICMLVTVFSYSIADAEVKHGDKFRDWTYQCDEAPTGQKAQCYISQTLTVGKERKGRILSVNIGHLKGAGDPTMIMLFPLGLAVQEKILLQVDEGKAYQGVIETCISTGCRMNVNLTTDLISLMKKGKKLKVSFQPMGRKRMVVEVSMPQ